MNSRTPLLLALALATVAVAADDKKKDNKAKSDLLPPDKRRATVELGQHLTRPPAPEPLPAELAQPFNPPGFDLPDRSETPPAPQPGLAGGGGPAPAPGGAPGPAAPAAPAPGEREKLDSLAAKLNPTGTILLGGNRLLSFGTKNVRIGADFTVTTNGQDYVLKLVAVDATTFTVRLGADEVTRPIKPGK
ncbi:MAG: hypothetical protein HZA93_09475 [Verrucomicrobia bacterium]|nr:hypothetical protein [Verrucomicrobiota bacterium]